MNWPYIALIILATLLALSALGTIGTQLSRIADELTRLRVIADQANRRTESLTPNPNAPFPRPGTRR